MGASVIFAPVFVYAVTIFIGAFLLFQVQPMIGKYILPWFGGAPSVWTVCMLFFQVLLLGGYAYAHFTSRWLKIRTQVIVYCALLVAALALLPITPSDSWKPSGSENPTLLILGLLAVSIGLPYFVLSSTSPLMQHWFNRTNPSVSPYRLYALSNIGSLLALVSYPIYFEAQFTRTMQATLWGCGLAAYAVCGGFCAMKLWKTAGGWRCGTNSERPKSEESESKERDFPKEGLASSNRQLHVFDRLLWLLLPACASVLLLATTNKICQDVAVVPFLWVLPLALYLLSFIICFDNPRWYARLPFILALTVTMAGICWALFKGTAISVQLQLSIYIAGLFVCCMVCHGELYRLKPDPKHLTGFYLMIAAGGAMGGFFVAIDAPLIFTDYFELQWGLLLCVLLFLLVCLRDRNFGGFHRWRLPACAWLSASLVTLGVVLWLQAHKTASGNLHCTSDLVYRSRNFYGVLKVYRNSDATSDLWYTLHHGRTLHGLQFADPLRASWPTSYYSEESGVGLALHALSTAPRRIGLVGLGTGTLATYARTGDYVHIYEINPAVLRLATSMFTYLINCHGKVEVTLGDARLSLEREPPQDFDLLALDAFNGDAIPVHLLTQEAFTVYQRHLKPKGILAVHITNRSLDLEPVVINLARRFNYKATIVKDVGTPGKWWIQPSVWMLLSHSEEIINSPTIHLAARPLQTNFESIPLWTDDFTSLFQILRSERTPQILSKSSEAQIKIAYSLWVQGNFAEAIAHDRLILKAQPDSPTLLNNLAWMMVTCPDASLRNGPEAVQLAEKACQLTHYSEAVRVSTLAAAYAEVGRFDDAIWMEQKACALASKSGAPKDWLERNQELLALYLKHQPYHQTTKP
ncbi:MAG: fused MFS/spermidine synthase [Verrucomicrobiota bacterium]|jgi:SAM-dependent methyltransferase